jgi:CRP-like cAMP-binding protein
MYTQPYPETPQRRFHSPRVSGEARRLETSPLKLPIPANLQTNNAVSDSWHVLFEGGRFVKLRAEQDLWLEGQDNLYIVLKGMMRLYRLTDEGKATTIVAATTGGILGRHPYLTQPRRGMIAEAMTETVLLTLTLEQFQTFMEDSAYYNALHTWLLRDLDNFHSCIFDRLQTHEAGAREKLARILLTISAAGLAHKLKRRQIAELANLTVETTVRLITVMTDEGLLKNREVTSLDDDEQRALSRIIMARGSSLPYL